MADAIHYLVKAQPVAPYISMWPYYGEAVHQNGAAAVNSRRTCAMRTFDVIENAIYFTSPVAIYFFAVIR